MTAQPINPLPFVGYLIPARVAGWDRADVLNQLTADHQDHVAALARKRMHDLPRRHPALAGLLRQAVVPADPLDLRNGVSPAKAVKA